MQARSKARLRLMVAVRSQVGGVERWLQTWTRVRVGSGVGESLLHLQAKPTVVTCGYVPAS